MPSMAPRLMVGKATEQGIRAALVSLFLLQPMFSDIPLAHPHVSTPHITNTMREGMASVTLLYLSLAPMVALLLIQLVAI